MKFSRSFSPLFARRVFAVCALAAILGASGCAQKPVSNATQNKSGSTTGSTLRATWGVAFQKWWQTLSQPQAQMKSAAPNVKSKSDSPAQTEIAAIAARHPAWKLADAFEQNRMEPLQFEAIASRFPQAGSTPSAPTFDVDFSASNNAENSTSRLPAPALNENGDSENAESDFAAPIVIEADADTLRQDARERQENSIAGFLSAAQTRQTDWQRDYRAVLQTALGEEIEAAQQRVPGALNLVLPSPELQLEMTNLRLQLLSNVFSTPAERKKAEARLQELMALWRANLVKQEKIRAAELERLRVEEPARLRRARMEELETQLETIQRTRQANRDAIAKQHRARVEADFGNENARLILALPALREPGGLSGGNSNFSTSAIEIGQNEVNSFLEKIIFPRTRAPGSASVSAFSGVASSQTTVRTAREEQIRALRALAWRDAKRQVKMAQRLKN